MREGEWDNNGVLAPPTHRRTSIKLTGSDAIRAHDTSNDAILSTIDISGPSHRVKTDAAWTGDSFVSNLGKTAESTSATATTTTRTAIAQQFTTRGAATLRAVRIDASFGTTATVTIFSDSSGSPGTNLGVLPVSGTLHSTAQVHEFRAAAAGVALTADTPYYVVVTGVNAAVKRTAVHGEDGAWGWTLADDYHAQASSSWTQQSGALKLALLGTSSAAPPAAPRVSGKPVVDTPGRDCAWTADEAVEVTLAFSEEVTVDTTGGTPTLKLQLGFQDDRTATYLSGSGTTALLFSYTITAADGRNLSMNVLQNGLRLNGATIQSTETGADARTAHDHGNYGARPRGKCAPLGGRESLVGNLEKVTRSGNLGISATVSIAQSFETGDGGGTLHAVQIRSSFASTQVQISIYSDNSGAPGSNLGTLRNPGTVHLTGRVHEFRTSASGLALAANTTYWVVGERDGNVSLTSDTDEDGVSGWTIGDRYWQGSGTTWAQGGLAFAISMKLLGLGPGPVPEPDPPRIVGAPFIPTPPPCYQCAGLWKSGRSVEVRLTFSEPVTVKYRQHYTDSSGRRRSRDTEPTVDIYLGGEVRRTVKYARGSGTRTLVFVYWVTAADGSYNSISVSPNSLALNDGEIYSPSSGLAAELAHAGVGKIEPLLVGNLSKSDDITGFDGSTVTRGAQAFTAGAGGATLRRVVLHGEFTTSTKVSVYSDSSDEPGASVATLENPAGLTSTRSALGNHAFSTDTGGLALSADTTYWVVVEGAGVVRATAQDSEDGLSGWSIGSHYWSLTTGNPWRPASSQSLRMALYGTVGGAMAQVVDPPTVSGGPAVSAAGSDGAWAPDETVEVTLTFSEAVTVDTTDGTPSLGLSLGGTEARSAAYASGSGTAELVFGYTLVAADGSHTSMAVAPNSLALNGGTIRSQAHGIDADLTLPGTLVLGTRGGEQGVCLPASPRASRACPSAMTARPPSPSSFTSARRRWA